MKNKSVSYLYTKFGVSCTRVSTHNKCYSSNRQKHCYDMQSTLCFVSLAWSYFRTSECIAVNNVMSFVCSALEYWVIRHFTFMSPGVVRWQGGGSRGKDLAFVLIKPQSWHPPFAAILYCCCCCCCCSTTIPGPLTLGYKARHASFEVTHLDNAHTYLAKLGVFINP